MSAPEITREMLADSFSVIEEQVHARAFLSKLASRGHVAETPEEAEALVAYGFKVAAADPSVLTPDPFVAPASRPMRGKYASALGDLQAALGQPAEIETDHLQKVAMQLAQDPQIYQAALLLKQAETLNASRA